MQTKSTKTLYLVIHGKTLRDEDPSCYFMFLNFDPPLSRSGFLATKRLALSLKKIRNEYSIILCSPFRACLDTATLMGKILNIRMIVVEKNLSDFFDKKRSEFKYFVGLKPSQIKTDYPQVTIPNNFPEKWWPTWPEDEKTFTKRIYDVFCTAPNNAILVTHRTVVEKIFSSIMGNESFKITLSSCFEIKLDCFSRLYVANKLLMQE